MPLPALSPCSDENLADKRELVVTGLKPLLQDSNLRVRQALAQLIIAMGHHDYLRLEGGQQLLRFIVAQCSISEVRGGVNVVRRAGSLGGAVAAAAAAGFQQCVRMQG